METNEGKGTKFIEELSQLEALLANAQRELEQLETERAELKARADNGSESAWRKLQDDDEGSLRRCIAAKKAEIGRLNSSIYDIRSNAGPMVVAAAPPDEDYS